MSRTDKDRPYWVRGTYFEPYHFCGIGDSGVALRDDCNLPIEPPRINYENYASHYSRRARDGQSCYWIMNYPDTDQLRGVRIKVLRRKMWNKPHRGAVRNAARRAMMGDWDVEFPDGRTRHRLAWLLD